MYSYPVQRFHTYLLFNLIQQVYYVRQGRTLRVDLAGSCSLSAEAAAAFVGFFCLGLEASAGIVMMLSATSEGASGLEMGAWIG